MLDMAFGLSDTSRLGCQVKLTRELDGMTATLPAATRNMFVDGAMSLAIIMFLPQTLRRKEARPPLAVYFNDSSPTTIGCIGAPCTAVRLVLCDDTYITSERWGHCPYPALFVGLKTVSWL
jgi:hypothetical protein